eukprot:803120_1
MSSFNYSSPYKPGKHHLFGPSEPSAPSATLSTLNPTASSYIPLNGLNALNAGAAPYIPLPLTINLCKPTPPAKKTLCPSFAYYEQIDSSTIYNSTSKYQNQFETLSCASSTETLETLETPIPASVTSSVYSECDSFDLDKIEPYVPNNRHDIDDIHDIARTTQHRHENINISIISETADCESPHPAIAALSATEYKQLLNAPVWSPQHHHKHVSKIAIDEEDYQFILHPNKKPIKYGSHIAHPSHCLMGESYDEYTLPNAHTAPAATTDTVTDTCAHNLYKAKASRIAVEGYSDHSTVHTMATQSHKPKIAHDAKQVTTMPYFGETQSRVASPFIQHVSYVHCVV